jgi:hypothetical protein
LPGHSKFETTGRCFVIGTDDAIDIVNIGRIAVLDEDRPMGKACPMTTWPGDVSVRNPW